MAKSGIAVSEALAAQLVAHAEDKSVAAIEVRIEEEGPSFKLVGTTPRSSPEGEFKEIAGKLPRNEPTYHLYHTSTGKWCIVFWVPDISKVKHRMVYASSIAELQKGFGESKFAQTPIYRISEPAECTSSAYAKTLVEIDKAELLTKEEVLASQARQDSVQAIGSSKVTAIVGMRVKISDGAVAALHKVKDKKTNTAILHLTQDTEQIELIEEGNFSIDQVSAKMTKTDARFILHNFRHEKEDKSEGEANVYVYYCPDLAKPKAKLSFAYATAVVVQTILDQGIEIAKKLEMNVASELSKENLLDELYPRQYVAKKAAKPKPQGKRGLIGGAKFSASPVSPASPASPEGEE